MALRNLSTDTMIALSSSLLDPRQPARGLLEKCELTAALLPRLARAHEGLLASQERGAPAELTEELSRIRTASAEIDLRHDKKARGVYLSLSGLAELSEDDEEAAAIIDLRELLFPRGTAIVTRTYLEEAGETTLARGRIDEPSRELLKRLPSLHGRTISEEVDAWMEAGDELGKLEAKRESTEAAIAASPRTTSPSGQNRARTAWVRVLTALADNLNLEEQLDDDLRQYVLEPLREAEAQADRRVGPRKRK